MGRSSRRSPSSSETPNTPGRAPHPNVPGLYGRSAGSGRTLPHKPVRDRIRSPRSGRLCLCVCRQPAFPSFPQIGQGHRFLPGIDEHPSWVHPWDHRVPRSRRYSSCPPATLVIISPDPCATGATCSGLHTANPQHPTRLWIFTRLYATVVHTNSYNSTPRKAAHAYPRPLRRLVTCRGECSHKHLAFPPGPSPLVRALQRYPRQNEKLYLDQI